MSQKWTEDHRSELVQSCMDEVERRLQAPQQAEDAPPPPRVPRHVRRRALVTCSWCGIRYEASHSTVTKARQGRPVYCPQDRSKKWGEAMGLLYRSVARK